MKYSIKIIFISNLTILLFISCFSIHFLNIEINIDNQLEYGKEDNIDFSKYSTTIKPLVIYNPFINLINNNLDIHNKQFENNNLINDQLEKHINFANSHGIYGFGFYYPFFDKKIQYDPLYKILQNKNIKSNFFLLLANNNVKGDGISINFSQLFDNIKKYIEDERYIKFYNKSLIGITDNKFSKNILLLLKEKFLNNKLGEIFIVSWTDNYHYKSKKQKIYDGFFYSPSFTSLQKVKFPYNNLYYYFYTHLIYSNIFTSSEKEINLFRMSVAMNKYPLVINKTKSCIFPDYSPEKFYLLNKAIIEWTKKKYDKDNQYIFINNFNNLLNSPVFGYANINSFSKSLFGLPLILNNNINFNIQKLRLHVSVLIQAHIYYTELLNEIINKINNIPIPFDLYVTTNNEEKKAYIENYLKNQSKSNKFEILITQNKGRDVIPCLIQLKDILIKYKYFCHIHTKKHGPNKGLGKYWQNYLYENLLGSKIIITKILSDFESNNKLGFIFPEPFYFHIKDAYLHNYQNYYYIHKLFNILFPNIDIWAGNIFTFPVGNMFWARTKAVYQLFNDKIIKLAPEENGGLDGTIIHAIERFWLYLVKLNGFYYKSFIYYI